MRKNLPVTDVEYEIREDAVIVSKTDAKGRIVFVNRQFIEASGFAEEELMGQPHNLVRHPDMPAEAFVDLWETVKAGRPWVGAVKNRRKDGSYYWVLASVTPEWEEGRITGFMSVRSRLPADQRAEAERAYGQIALGAAGWRLVGGVLRRRQVFDVFSVFVRTLRARVMTQVVLQAVFMILVGAASLMATRHIVGLADSMYADRVVPMQQLSEINERTRAAMWEIFTGAERGRSGGDPGDVESWVRTASSEIDRLWSGYMANNLTPDEKAAAESFAAHRAAFVDKGVKPVLEHLREGRFAEAAAAMAGPAALLYDAAKVDLDRLIAIQVTESRVASEGIRRGYGVVAGANVAAVLVALFVAVLLGWRTAVAIARPLGTLNDVMDAIAQGRFNNRIRIEHDDEVGEALHGIQAMQGKLDFDREHRLEIEARVAEQRSEDMRRIADGFEAAVGEIVATVSSAATELEASAGSLTATAGRSQELAVSVAASSEQATANVQSVAAASEEMAASVGEIARQVQDSARIAGGAVEQAADTNARVAALAEAATRIGDVVKLIESIAGQTNLLALNATIEAARAGDAGRGFAVVASEVKALAEQTARATGEIGQQVVGIQEATKDSVAAIEAISRTIGSMAEISSAIASAVEQQGATTQEISRNVQQAAQGTGEVAVSIVDVQRGATETGSASAQVLSSARTLSRDGARLKSEVDDFLARVRAA